MKDQNGRNPLDKGLHTVRVPESLQSVFRKAQEYVDRYFQERTRDPGRGFIEVSGERYILVRAASMSKEFFELVTSLYRDRGEKEARAVTLGFLFDIAHSIGKADARSFFSRMGVSDPIEKLSAGPIHFSYTGWAFVEILPESHPSPDDDYYLIYDHPFSFEAHTWLKGEKRTDFPVCTMNAGYSSGWCEESFGIPLVAAEIECRAKGDEHCRFIMAPPYRIKEHIARYGKQSESGTVEFSGVDIPEFFQRKRLEDELRRHRDHLEDLVRERTESLSRTNERLQREITERRQAERALQKSETMLRAIFDQTFQFIGVLSLDGSVVQVNKTAMDFVGTNEAEINGKPFWNTPWWTHSRQEQERLKRGIARAAQGDLVRYETTNAGPNSRTVHMDISIKPVRNAEGRIVLLISEGRDITDLKLAMDDLQASETELKVQSRSLEEANIALKVLLKQMEEKKRNDQENVLSNLKQLVLPYIERLKRSLLNEEEQAIVNTLESNLTNITSPLIQRLSATSLGLTPMEIRIAHLVREGLTNKEIGELLGISLNTVSSHRHKIRSKLGLRNKGSNLRSYLMSIEE
ncbi:MAG: PAS domain S-box protein [Thermodesulfobacteriota bacterium]